jgi:hypothetical protein
MYAIVSYHSIEGADSVSQIHSIGEDLQILKARAIKMCKIYYNTTQQHILVNFEWLNRFSNEIITYAHDESMIFAVVEVKN